MTRAHPNPETRPIDEIDPAVSDTAKIGQATAETRDPADLETLPPTPIEAAVSKSRRTGFRRSLFVAALGCLAAGLIGAGVDDLVRIVLSGGGWPYQLMAVGVFLLGLVALTIGVREGLALARLRRLERHQNRARAVQAGNGSDDRRLVTDLTRLYANRPDLEWALAAYRQERRASADVPTQLNAFERTVLATLDQAAETAIARAARRAAGGAAVSPFAALDLVITAAVDLRLVGEIARIYSGRPGWLASWRLLKLAFADVVAAGATDLSQGTVADMLGTDLTARFSTRAGSALVNALLTAKLGRAAITACRPVPFHVRQPSGSRALLLRGVGQAASSPS